MLLGVYLILDSYNKKLKPQRPAPFTTMFMLSYLDGQCCPYLLITKKALVNILSRAFQHSFLLGLNRFYQNTEGIESTELGFIPANDYHIAVHGDVIKGLVFST